MKAEGLTPAPEADKSTFIRRATSADALVDARRSARRLRRYEQALDHPVLPTLPETEYFRGMLLEMMPGR
jgi:23S rRNA (cytosine1962-C5)-methyltransferase